MKILTDFGLIIIFIPTVLQAALQWDTRAVVLQLKADQSTVDVAFPFKNTGKNPVSILKVEPSCPCMSANKVTGIYQAGESGVLKVRYHVGAKLGTVVEGITVHTSDPTEDTVNLRLTVSIPVAFGIQPGFVFWGVGEAAEPRDVY